MPNLLRKWDLWGEIHWWNNSEYSHWMEWAWGYTQENWGWKVFKAESESQV